MVLPASALKVQEDMRIEASKAKLSAH